MPRGKVRAAEARIANTDAAVMAAISSARGTQKPPPAAAELSAVGALDECDRILASGRLSEREKEHCIACLERCEELWSDEDSWEYDETFAELPHERALVSLGVAMSVACTHGEPSTNKADRKLFVYACMLLPAVVVPLADRQGGDGFPVGATTFVDAAEVALRERIRKLDGGSNEVNVSLASLLATGLTRLNEQQPAPSADVAVPVLGALAALARSMLQCGEAGGAAPTIGAMHPAAMSLPVAHATSLLKSGAIAAAIATAAVHPTSREVSKHAIGALAAAAGDHPDRLLMCDVQLSGVARHVSMCDALADVGALSPVVHAIRAFASPLAIELLDALTSTAVGRHAARACDAMSALDAQIIGCAEGGDEDGSDSSEGSDAGGLDIDQLKVLRAVIAADDLAAIMNELAPGVGLGGCTGVTDDAPDEEALDDSRAAETDAQQGEESGGPPYMHGCAKTGVAAWYWY